MIAQYSARTFDDAFVTSYHYQIKSLKYLIVCAGRDAFANQLADKLTNMSDLVTSRLSNR